MHRSEHRLKDKLNIKQTKNIMENIIKQWIFNPITHCNLKITFVQEKKIYVVCLNFIKGFCCPTRICMGQLSYSKLLTLKSIIPDFLE